MSCSKLLELPSPEEARSCAFCLTPISKGTVLKCAKCSRRAYCGRDCQVADWRDRREDAIPYSPTAAGYGQGHKNWCSLACGEEGLDWAIREIPGKGRGLVALRDFLPLERIIVEGYQGRDQPLLEEHPGFQFLRGSGAHQDSQDDPCKGNAEVGIECECCNDFKLKCDKFDFNAIGSSGCGTVLGLRIALGNHSCDGNAAFTDDEDFKVLILYSLRHITAGEEICFQYDRYNDIRRPLPDLEARNKNLKERWGIECPAECLCKDVALHATLLDLHRLHVTLEPLCQKKNFESAVRKMKFLLNKAEKVGLGPNILSTIHFWAFQLYCSRRKTVGKGKAHIRKVIEFQEAVYHPKNHTDLGMFKEMEANPRVLEGYGMGD